MLSFDLAILSGGMGINFHAKSGKIKDKTLAIINGRSILEILIDHFSGFGDHLLVICGITERCKTYKTILSLKREGSNSHLKLIPDFTDSGFPPGPLRGISTALYSAKSEVVVTIPNDTPFLLPEHVSPLADQMTRADVCTPIWPDGRLFPLVAAYQRQKIVRSLPILGILERSRADDPIRACQSVCFLPINPERPNESRLAFFNINTPERLSEAKKISRKTFSVISPYTSEKKRVVQIHTETDAKLVCRLAGHCDNWTTTIQTEFETRAFELADDFKNHKMYFWEALSSELLNHFLVTARNTDEDLMAESSERASKAYYREHQFWKSCNQPFLALHCLLDHIQFLDPKSEGYYGAQIQINRYRTSLFGSDIK